jgi:CheY-like chemotaxis protein
MSAGPVNPVVLIVEDDWLLRQALLSELEDAGWTVLEAGTAQAALAFLNQGQHLDLLITDIHLGGTLSGWDVAEAFRAAAVALPVIYTSGNPSIAARRVPGSAFLSKPLVISELLDISYQLMGGDDASLRSMNTRK